MRSGFIRLGNMGGPNALNGSKAGHTMVVTDRRRQLAKPHLAQGASWADTPKAIAQASEVVFTLAAPRMEAALRRGWGDRGSNTVFSLQTERAGVQLRTGGA